jgi:AAA+ ATPase superfamily predicted ATPase
MNKEEKKNLLRRVFTPSAPIKDADFFIGRLTQLKQIVDSINHEGQHAIVYGERGVGKTSLANNMTTKITNLHSIKVTCNRQDDFLNLWKRAFDEIHLSRTIEGIGFVPSVQENIEKLGSYLEGLDELSPSDVEGIVKKLPSQLFLFIFDEFDNINSKKIRHNFADLIKSFSDNVKNATVVIVGIADNVEDLIGSHPSLERCLKQVKMPILSNDEAIKIIENGFIRFI